MTEKKDKSTFEKLLSKDVSKHVEKKGKFSYLSWSYAVAELSQLAPDATWEVREWPCRKDHAIMVPYLETPLGFFVEVSVTVCGVKRSSYLPVMDERNKVIQQPDAFDINKAHQRALVKAIALHGLGLNVYAGEDLPLGADEEEKEPEPKFAGEDAANRVVGYARELEACPDLAALDALVAKREGFVRSLEPKWRAVAEALEDTSAARITGNKLDPFDAETTKGVAFVEKRLAASKKSNGAQQQAAG